MIYTCVGILTAIVHLPTMITLFLLCFLLNSHGTFFFLQILNLFICAIFGHNLLPAEKEIYYLWLFIINNKCRNQVPVIKPREHWKTEHYWELDDCCEVDIDSDISRLAQSKLWQYTTVRIQGEWLPWNRMWRLLYFDHWSSFENFPGSV